MSDKSKTKQRLLDWEINANLEPRELANVVNTGDEIVELMKNNKLSHYQAKKTLDYVIVLLEELEL